METLGATRKRAHFDDQQGKPRMYIPPKKQRNTFIPNCKFDVCAEVQNECKTEYIRLAVQSSNTVGKLRRYLSRKYNCRRCQITVMVGVRSQFKILFDHQTFAQAGINTKSFLHVCINTLSEEEDNFSVLNDAASFVSMQLRQVDEVNLLKFQLQHFKEDDDVVLYDMQVPEDITGESLCVLVANKLGLVVSEVQFTYDNNRNMSTQEIVGDFLKDSNKIVQCRRVGDASRPSKPTVPTSQEEKEQPHS